MAQSHPFHFRKSLFGGLEFVGWKAAELGVDRRAIGSYTVLYTVFGRLVGFVVQLRLENLREFVDELVVARSSACDCRDLCYGAVVTEWFGKCVRQRVGGSSRLREGRDE